jgi:hypothetical protein
MAFLVPSVAGQSFRRFSTRTVKHSHLWDCWSHVTPSQTAVLKSALTLPFHLRFQKNRTALFWVITQRVVVISYRRFGTTYRSHLQGARTVTLKSRTVSERFIPYNSECRPVHTCLMEHHNTCVTPWSWAICQSRIFATVIKLRLLALCGNRKLFQWSLSWVTSTIAQQHIQFVSDPF